MREYNFLSLFFNFDSFMKTQHFNLDQQVSFLIRCTEIVQYINRSIFLPTADGLMNFNMIFDILFSSQNGFYPQIFLKIPELSWKCEIIEILFLISISGYTKAAFVFSFPKRIPDGSTIRFQGVKNYDGKR